jgi:hypothetical protein
MHLNIIVRRAVISTGAALSLVTGGLAIRAATEWALASATKVEPPAGIVELQARIESAEARAASIRTQIDRLAGGSDSLAQMIQMANAMAVTDQVATDALHVELTQARDALAAQPTPEPDPTPTPAPVRTTTRSTTTTVSKAAPTPTPTPRHHDDD